MNISEDKLIKFTIDGNDLLFTYSDLLELHTEMGMFLNSMLAGNLDIKPIQRQTDKEQEAND